MFAVLALAFSWFGCLCAFAGAEQQPVYRKKIRPLLGWIFFALWQLLALVILTFSYGWMTSSVQLLVAIMCGWPILVISHGHAKHGLDQVLNVSIGVLILMGLLTYVA